MDLKKKLFDVFNKILTFQIRNSHFENVLEFYVFFIGSYFKRTFKICSIIFNQPFLHLFIEELNIYIHKRCEFNLTKKILATQKKMTKQTKLHDHP
jgi:hypothetical protein